MNRLYLCLLKQSITRTFKEKGAIEITAETRIMQKIACNFQRSLDRISKRKKQFLSHCVDNEISMGELFEDCINCTKTKTCFLARGTKFRVWGKRHTSRLDFALRDKSGDMLLIAEAKMHDREDVHLQNDISRLTFFTCKEVKRFDNISWGCFLFFRTKPDKKKFCKMYVIHQGKFTNSYMLDLKNIDEGWISCDVSTLATLKGDKKMKMEFNR